MSIKSVLWFCNSLFYRLAVCLSCGVMENSRVHLDPQFSDRVTTDAAHRRFTKKGKNTDKKNGCDVDFYYCKQCNVRINALEGKEELKFHFERIKHIEFCKCVYCTKPVYDYNYKNKLEVYHSCHYD